MVPAAGLTIAAQEAIESHMAEGRRAMRTLVGAFRRWLRSPACTRCGPEEAQRRFVLVRMRFNAVLSQFDIFADVLTQRSEHAIGVWLAGLDAVAGDALQIPGLPPTAPPVACYLDRGHGAAIRRARTRLPGGAPNPVAIIRVPRERMVGSGVASSLVHEVGHQGAQLIGLDRTLIPLLKGLQSKGGPEQSAWVLWERWISEIVADFWSVAVVGIGAPMGLLAVVSLPRAFVFRFEPSDPHPIPWIRVRLSCAMGHALYPHSQWGRLSAQWESFYPSQRAPAPIRELLENLNTTMPAFIALLTNHRMASLGGRSVREVFARPDRDPRYLAQLGAAWSRDPMSMRRTRPALAMAVMAQAKADGLLTPERESRLLSELLNYWAMQDALRSVRMRRDTCGTPERVGQRTA
jgi:hypothetical protein